MKTIILYAIGVYLSFLCFGLYLNSAHGEPLGNSPQRTKPASACGEYLHICESSCSRRGDMYRFLCLGPTFQALEQYRCQCGDEAFRQVAKKEQNKPEPKQAAIKTTEQEQEPEP